MGHMCDKYISEKVALRVTFRVEQQGMALNAIPQMLNIKAHLK